jgi:hypothetical protein
MVEVGGEVKMVEDRAVLSCARESKWNLPSAMNMDFRPVGMTHLIASHRSVLHLPSSTICRISKMTLVSLLEDRKTS